MRASHVAPRGVELRPCDADHVPPLLSFSHLVSKLARIVLCLALAGCAAHTQPAWFQRYTPADQRAFQRDLEATRHELATLRGAHGEREALRLAADLGGMLVSARREAEAVALLEPTLHDARRLGDDTTIGWSLLNLATANQYLRERAAARRQFDAALEVAQRVASPELEHYVLHHRGRFRVESNDLAGARADFERALVLRLALKDAARVASTRRALDALRARDAQR